MPEESDRGCERSSSTCAGTNLTSICLWTFRRLRFSGVFGRSFAEFRTARQNHTQKLRAQLASPKPYERWRERAPQIQCRLSFHAIVLYERTATWPDTAGAWGAKKR